MRTEAARREDRARLIGLGVSPGVAIGRAYVVEARIAHIPHYEIAPSEAEAEITRFTAAVDIAKTQLAELAEGLSGKHGDAADELREVLEAHRQILDSARFARGVARRIGEAHVNAESAVAATAAEFAGLYESMTDSYLAARAADMRDLGERLLRVLTEAPEPDFQAAPEGAVVCAEELSPAEAALLDPHRIRGLASVGGGPEGHAAIITRSLGIPAVMGVAGLLEAVANGDPIALDGARGRVIVDPGAASVAALRDRRAAYARERAALATLASEPAVTRDGVRIALNANIELPLEVEAALSHGAAGVGLLRSEFLFMNRDRAPDEDEQTAALIDIVAAMKGRPVTIRTLDVGGEKPVAGVPELELETVNPALGLRAVRLFRTSPEILKTQFAAILRAGAIGPVRALLPMVTRAEEIEDARAALEEAAADLRARGLPHAERAPPLGVMIEAPAAALTADSLARAADFFSVGSNDLTMYTLAVDRSNDQVAALYDPMNPAVLRLTQFAAAAAATAGLPINVCGEIAGDPRFTGLLIGLGFRDLSMAGGAIPRVKQRVRAIDASAARDLADAVMREAEPKAVAALVDRFNAGLDAQK